MGRQATDKVRECFRYHDRHPKYPKTRAAECRYCNEMESDNTTRMACHLAVCMPYLRYKLDKATERGQTGSTRPVVFGDSLGPEQVKKLNNLACLMVYQCGLPFTFFERPAVQAFLHELRPAYKPLSSYTVSHSGLESAYQAIKSEVDRIIKEEEHINICFDGGSDLTHNRLLNISIGTKRGTFFYTNINLGAATADSEFQAERIIQEISVIVGDYSRINSVSGDTCSTMEKTFRLISEDPRLKYAFMIPCDCHGLQLLLKDILTSPAYSPTVTAVNLIVNHLQHAPKQYQVLKELQRELKPDREPLAFVVGSETRWGSQYKAIKRIQLAEMSLRRWRTDSRILEALMESERGRAVAQILMQPTFFHATSELTNLMGPIVDEIAAAEGDHCHIGLVIPRWQRIWKHLAVIRSTSTQTTDWDTLQPILEARYQRQTTPLHLLAFWLLPTTIVDGFRFNQLTGEQTRVLATLRQYCTPHEYEESRPAFLNYYTQQESFHRNHDSWRDRNAKIFWQQHWDTSPVLARLAIRLWNTLANEVPCERAFSALGHIKTKTRSRLTDKHVDQLLFVQMNTRVLTRTPTKAKNNSKPSEAVEDDSDDDIIIDIAQGDEFVVSQTSLMEGCT
jgi:hypothetical protein